MATPEHDWSRTSAARHINNPYSDAALAEESKSYIDLGLLDMDGCISGSSSVIKRTGEDPDLGPQTPPALLTTHRLYIGAAKKLLTEPDFEDSTIEFTHRYGADVQVADRPHVDGEFRRPAEKLLKLVGIACTKPTTILFQGKLTQGNLSDDGRLISMRNLNRRFKAEPVPESRLILMGPAMLHQRPHVSQVTSPRLFMRWHLKV